MLYEWRGAGRMLAPRKRRKRSSGVPNGKKICTLKKNGDRDYADQDTTTQPARAWVKSAKYANKEHAGSKEYEIVQIIPGHAPHYSHGRG